MREVQLYCPRCDKRLTPDHRCLTRRFFFGMLGAAAAAVAMPKEAGEFAVPQTYTVVSVERLSLDSIGERRVKRHQRWFKHDGAVWKAESVANLPWTFTKTEYAELPFAIWTPQMEQDFWK